ncbi:MAG: glycerol-3-phosphate 1-O-acyltransferase PlsY [Bacteroidetes bacterium]|nr:glycerol-3-phosphate 1-O-acyltransferase PlsY [Bacteroidota bacterium]
MTIHLPVAILLAYFIGSIPTSVWIGRWFYHTDVRTLGSKNAGATNTIRVLGLKAGIPVLILDVFKGWFAVYIAHFLWNDTNSFPDLVDFKIMLAIAAVIGHVFPVYVGFKGGKGIATLLGVGIALYPLAAFVAVIIFAVTLILTRYVSLSSIVASVTFPFVEIFFLGNNEFVSLVILSFAVAVFVPVTHRKNIVRLLKNEETKFTVKRKKERKS